MFIVQWVLTHYLCNPGIVPESAVQRTPGNVCLAYQGSPHSTDGCPQPPSHKCKNTLYGLLPPQMSGECRVPIVTLQVQLDYLLLIQQCWRQPLQKIARCFQGCLELKKHRNNVGSMLTSPWIISTSIQQNVEEQLKLFIHILAILTWLRLKNDSVAKQKHKWHQGHATDAQHEGGQLCRQP